MTSTNCVGWRFTTKSTVSTSYCRRISPQNSLKTYATLRNLQFPRPIPVMKVEYHSSRRQQASAGRDTAPSIREFCPPNTLLA
jgi:hypothetical protein